MSLSSYSSQQYSRVSDSYSYSNENMSEEANVMPLKQKRNQVTFQSPPQTTKKSENEIPSARFVSYLEFSEMEKQMKQYQTDFHEAEETIDDLEQSLKAVLLAVSNVTKSKVKTIDDALRIISSFANQKNQNNESERVLMLTEQLKEARKQILELESKRGNDEKIEQLNEKISLIKDQRASSEKLAINTQKKLAKVIEENQTLKQQLKEQKNNKTKAKKGKEAKKTAKGKCAAKNAKAKSPQKKGKAIVAENNAQIASLETRIKELQFELEECRDSLRTPEQSLSSSSTVPSIIMSEQVLQQFEDLVAAQADEIQQLYHQRDQLLDLATTLETNVEEAEETIEEANEENEKLNGELEIAHSDIERMKQSNKIEIEKLRNKIVEILPKAVAPKIQLVQDLPADRQIVEYFNFANAEIEAAEKRSYENISDEKMPQVLAQLENALRFIKEMSLAADHRPLLEDDQFKLDVMTQIKNMQEFVDSMPKNTIREPSIFDARDSDQQVKAFLEIAGDEANTSPVRELFTLFSGVVLANKMLLQRVQSLEPLRQTADKKQVENEKLIALLQEEATNQNKLSNPLIELTDEQLSFYEMVESLIEKYKEITALNDASRKELQTIRNDVAQIEKKTTESALEKEAKYKNKIHTLKKNNLSLNQQVGTLKDENKKLIEKMINCVNESATVTEQANTNKTQLNTALEQIEELKVHKTNEKMLEKKCKELEDTIVELQSKVSELTTAKAIADKVIKSSKDNNKKLTASKEKLQKTNRDLKDEIAALKTINGQIFEDIKNRNANLSDRIDGRLKLMEESVKEANRKYDEAEAIRKEFIGKKKDYQKEIAQLKATERSLLVKIEELEKRNELSKKQMKAELDAKILATKAENDRDQMSTKDFVICCLKRLAQLIESNFFIQISGEIDLWDVVNILEEQLHNISADELSKVVNDNTQSRAILGIDKQGQLWEGVQELVDHSNQLTADKEKMKENIDDLEKQINELQDLNDDLFERRAEADEWRQWAQSLYQTVNNGAVSDNYKKAIEEIVLSGNGNKTLERKLSILRTEKSILKTHYDDLEDLPKPIIYSIRPQTIAFMFIRRLQVCSGTLPTYLQLNVSKK